MLEDIPGQQQDIGAGAVCRVDHRGERAVAVAAPGTHRIAVVDMQVGRVDEDDLAGRCRHSGEAPWEAGYTLRPQYRSGDGQGASVGA